MATSATLEKLNELVGANDMTVSEIKFVLKHWDDAPKRLYGNVIKSVKALEKIPAAVQVDLINASDRAVRALGEILSPEAQEVVIAEYKDDIPLLVRLAPKLVEISDGLWKVLAAVVKGGKYDIVISTASVKKLTRHEGCPPIFAKAIGLTRETFEKEQAKGKVKKQPPHTDLSDEDEDDEDFTDVRSAAKAVRAAKRK